MRLPFDSKKERKIIRFGILFPKLIDNYMKREYTICRRVAAYGENRKNGIFK